MERFTGYDKDGSPYMKHKYLDDDGLPTVEYIYDQLSVNDNAIKTFAEYEDLQEQGRLIVLPCKVGDIVYCAITSPGDCQFDGDPYICGDCNYCSFPIDDCLHHESEEWECGFESHIREKVFALWMIDFVGKTVFLTRDEAETALTEKGGK